MHFISFVLLIAIPTLVAITFHEAAHAYVARELGDETGLRQGRITFNPFKHVDFIGTIVIPVALVTLNTGFIFGYAKPVPVNQLAFLNPRRGMMLVALAGPAMNLGLVVVSLGLAVMITQFHTGIADWIFRLCMTSVAVNFILAFVNILPVPPLDGGRAMVAALSNEAGVNLERAARFWPLVLLLLLVVVPWLGKAAGVDLNPLDALDLAIVHLVELLSRFLGR
jgi:Zn-dependent protease